MSEESNIIKLEQIISNEPRTLTVKGIGKIKVKDPSKKDRMEATKEANAMIGWDQLTELEKSVEVQNRITLKMIVEPKISEDDYLNSPDTKISKIIDAVSLDYSKRISDLNEERKSGIIDFLVQLVGKEELLKKIGKSQ